MIDNTELSSSERTLLNSKTIDFARLKLLTYNNDLFTISRNRQLR
jgi:hypothetical protein